jgi:hypothetical protein
MVKRLTLATIIFVAAVTVVDAQRPFVESEQANTFTALPRAKAVEAAKDLATRDFASGRFRTLVTGKTAWGDAYEDYLREHYGVQVMFLSMRQPEKAFSVSGAYNKTMRTLLKQKFRRDIFKEAYDATGQKW